MQFEVQWQDSVQTFIETYIVNGLKDMRSALQLEALISKKNEIHDVSVTLINPRHQNDVPKCSRRLYHFHPVIGVFIFPLFNFVCIQQGTFKLWE